jgi:hypothetical protein
MCEPRDEDDPKNNPEKAVEKAQEGLEKARRTRQTATEVAKDLFIRRQENHLGQSIRRALGL